ncbi:MAG TPA: ATP-binding cassette domain-containing protein, partial [Agromyces sp.]|nr:ATP-binding cassette domain-containing protein [Agromyces sp.]
MTLAIDVRGLGKRFGRAEVLHDLDLSVPEGQVFALLGPNGAGKTTTINILTTLVRPDAGAAMVAGFDVVRQPEDVKARISLTGQSAAVDEMLTGTENLVMLGRLSGLGVRGARVRAAGL